MVTLRFWKYMGFPRKFVLRFIPRGNNCKFQAACGKTMIFDGIGLIILSIVGTLPNDGPPAGKCRTMGTLLV
jgi:hypothetical protein